MIKIYPIGTKVILSNDIPGIITSVCLSPHNDIQYKVCWWSGRDRKAEWLYDTIDFEPDKYNKKEIGFIDV